MMKKLFPLLAAGLVFLSCATTNQFAPVDKVVERGDYVRGAAVLEEKKKVLYRDKDVVLYYLDKGMLTHYALDYGGSSTLLQEGERAIQAAFATSITQEIGTLVLNDTVREYSGEDYEDIYINAFNALNYYHRGNMEDALVEIRRMNNKLQSLSTKYGVLLTSLQKAALENSATIPPNPNGTGTKFSNSALARYLGMLFYRGIGKMDDARIDRDQIRVAFADAPELYPFPVPSSINAELAIPPGMARFNIIGFIGLSPVKHEETLRIPLGGSYIKIALPVMDYRPSSITRIEVVFDSGERFDLEPLEDIEAIARETFKQRAGVIYIKSILRATIKGLTSAALDVAAANTDNGNTSALFSILSFGTQIFAEASEKADLRVSRYFPAKAYVGGINLAPGEYSFTVNYYTGTGVITASSRRDNVPVRANNLNLTEIICLK
jgi:hypothetical protein